MTQRIRIDFETYARANGIPLETDRYGCECGKAVHVSQFIDVRDRPDLFTQAFVCEVCASDLMRREKIEAEQKAERDLIAAGRLPEEHLNTLRASRDMCLQRSDWTQLQDNRERIGPEASARWDAYRAACREWFASARDTGTVGDLPATPE